MVKYLLIALAGFAGSFHCIGMCGGFACALGSDPRGRQATLLRHLLYNTGRVSTYVFLGALAGVLGTALIHHGAPALPMATGQRALSVAAGALMLLMGMQLWGYFTPLRGSAGGMLGNGLVGALRRLRTAPGPAAPLALGVANGFLPCPLVYAFLAKAAASAAVAPAVLTMLCFGLGTFPAMLLTGSVGRLLAPVWRQRGVRLAGGFLLALGALTVARGLLPLDGHLGH